MLYFHLKMHQNASAAGFCPDPLGELTAQVKRKVHYGEKIRSEEEGRKGMNEWGKLLRSPILKTG